MNAVQDIAVTFAVELIRKQTIDLASNKEFVKTIPRVAAEMAELLVSNTKGYDDGTQHG